MSARLTPRAITAYPASATAQPHTVRGVAQTVGTTASSETYGFDTVGRMTSRTKSGATTTMTWDVEGHLATSTVAGQTTSFVYDAAGQRLIKRAPGTVTLYMGNTELTMNTSTNVVTGTRILSLGGAVAVRDVTGTVSIVVADHQGTGQWALNLSTQAAVQRQLTPFGQDRSGATSTWPAKRGFVGGVNDPENGLTHLGAREYDAALGSFISADPLIDPSDPEMLNGYSVRRTKPCDQVRPERASGPRAHRRLDHDPVHHRREGQLQQPRPHRLRIKPIVWARHHQVRQAVLSLAAAHFERRSEAAPRFQRR